jgi:hypothetical protein
MQMMNPIKPMQMGPTMCQNWKGLLDIWEFGIKEGWLEWNKPSPGIDRSSKQRRARRGKRKPMEGHS